MKPSRECEKNAEQLDRLRGKLNYEAEKIIAEQEGIIQVAEEGINKLNGTLTALKRRLGRFTGTDPENVFRNSR